MIPILVVVSMVPLQGHTPIDLAHQVHSPLLIHMLSHVKQERLRSNSRCLRVVNRYRVCLSQMTRFRLLDTRRLKNLQ